MSAAKRALSRLADQVAFDAIRRSALVPAITSTIRLPWPAPRSDINKPPGASGAAPCVASRMMKPVPSLLTNKMSAGS